MAAASLSIASIVHDRAAADRCLVPSLAALEGAAQPLLLWNEDNALGTRLAHLYNVLLRLDGPEVRAFLHPDVTFAPDFVARVAAAIAGVEESGSSWGALGIVGRTWGGEYVWSHDLTEPAPACTLDSCALVTRTDLGLAFDADRFDGLHCFVEDYCLQCHDAGLGVWVFPATARHEGATYAREGPRWGRYDRYRKRLDRKWRGRFPALTTT